MFERFYRIFQGFSKHKLMACFLRKLLKAKDTLVTLGATAMMMTMIVKWNKNMGL